LKVASIFFCSALQRQALAMQRNAGLVKFIDASGVPGVATFAAISSANSANRCGHQEHETAASRGFNEFHNIPFVTGRLPAKTGRGRNP
jgi:hypothetical protein